MAPTEFSTKFPTAYLGAPEGDSWGLVRKWLAGLSPASLHTLLGVGGDPELQNTASD